MNLFGIKSIILFIAFQPVQWQGIMYLEFIFWTAAAAAAASPRAAAGADDDDAS